MLQSRNNLEKKLESITYWLIIQGRDLALATRNKSKDVLTMSESLIKNYDKYRWIKSQLEIVIEKEKFNNIESRLSAVESKNAD